MTLSAIPISFPASPITSPVRSTPSTPTAASGANLRARETITFEVFSASAGGSVTVSSGGGGGGGCFLATAAYGSHMAKDVKVLHEVRDKYLLTNYLGRAFVSFYYKYSPKLAHWISKRPSLKSIVRVGLYPLVKAGKLLIETDKDGR